MVILAPPWGKGGRRDGRLGSEAAKRTPDRHQALPFALEDNTGLAMRSNFFGRHPNGLGPGPPLRQPPAEE
jgi:hypothetical protein